jgi:sulfur relay protein TusC/DsrF
MKILFTNHHAPYTNFQAEEGLELALLASSLAIEVDVLFCAAATYQYQAQQQSANIGRKSFNRMLTLLTHYDIHNVYVLGNNTDTAPQQYKRLEAKDLSHHLKQYDFIIGV